MTDKVVSTVKSRRDALLALTAAIVPGTVLGLPLRAAACAGGRSQTATAARAVSALAATARGPAELAAEHFEPLVGETFTIGENPVTLRRVSRLGKSGSPFREQFAVTFEAPANVLPPLEPLRVSHPAVGRHDLLVTQIGNPAQGTALEICFA